MNHGGTPAVQSAPGGLTDRYLSDYDNMFGDLSAQSGQNALTRDEDFARDFIARHRHKLLFGSDCTDTAGAGPGCIGAQTIAVIRRLAPSRAIERSLLHDNAARLLRLKQDPHAPLDTRPSSRRIVDGWRSRRRTAGCS